MALMFEYKPGMSLTDPWPFTLATQAGYFIDSTGKLVLAGTNTLRDRHYPFGKGSAIRTTLFEPNAVNSCLWSQSFANAAWTQVNDTASDNVATAPDGTVTASRLIPDITNVFNHRTRQQVTVTANEYVAWSVFLKADAYSGVRIRLVDSSGVNAIHASINLLTGAILESATEGATAPIPVLTGSFSIPLANGWYWVSLLGSVGGGFTLVQGQVHPFQTGAQAAAATAFSGDAASGILAWGAQFERLGTVPRGASSYVPTTTVTAARADMAVSTPWPFQMQAMWGYTAWYDLGGSLWTQSAPILTITGAVANTDPTWCPAFLRNNGMPGASYASGVGAAGLLGSNRNTISSNGSLGAVQPYDFVETFSRVMGDGTTYFDARRNGGTVFTNGPVGPAGTIPFADVLNPLLFLGRPLALTGPLVGVTVVRSGADPTRVTTLAQAAAA